MNLNFNVPGVLIDPMPSGSNQDPMPSNSNEPMPSSSNSAEPTDSVPSGLLAQALISHRSAVVRAGDKTTRTQTRGTVPSTVIWQWASSVRVNAIAREVLGNLRFEHGAYWLLPAMDSSGTLAPAATELLSLKAPSSATLLTQLDLVRDAADERPDRLTEILVQARSLWPFWTAVSHVVPGQAPRTAELMAVAQAVAGHMGHQFKHLLAVPRPTDLSPEVQPCITTPGHGAMPSGHAISAFMALRLLKALLANSKVGGVDTVGFALDRTARRIAANRVVAGLHFPLDNCAGWCVAETAFEILSMMAGRSPNKPPRRTFDAATTSVNVLPNDDLPLSDDSVGSTAVANAGAVVSGPLLTLLWEAAEAELSRLQLN